MLQFFIFRKHQLVKPITVEMKKQALASLLLEQKNLGFLQRPYLSEVIWCIKLLALDIY